MGERISAEYAEWLLDGTSPGPWHETFNKTNPTIYGASVDHDGLVSASGKAIVWSLFTEGDGLLSTHASPANAALIAAAPDLAATVIAQGADIAALRAEIAAARVGVVTAEVHARAVREAWGVIAGWWPNAPERTALLATLRASGLDDARAAALADGEVSDE